MAKQKFCKAGLVIKDQIALLKSRGLIIADEASAEHHLKQIGYYRLSGYMLAFQNKAGNAANPHNFADGTTFEEIITHYLFDRKLRLLVMDGIERIEISIRSFIINEICPANNAHWYMDIQFFYPKCNHSKLLSKIKKSINHDNNPDKPRDIHIDHYYNTYDTPDMPACWMVFESVSFGVVSVILENTQKSYISNIYKNFGAEHPVFLSWCHSLVYVRNLCAHHNRLWNKTLTIKPKIPKQFNAAVPQNDKVYALLFVMQIMLTKINTSNEWAENLSALIEDFEAIDIAKMGFPENWRTKTIWRLPLPSATPQDLP